MEAATTSGLTSAEVEERLKKFGYNELPSSKPKSIGRIALEVVKEPMFLLLLACGSLYLFIGDYQEGIILLSAIFVIIGITFYQYRKTERALDALKKLSSPRALVIREGAEMRISGREVVPDDIIILNEGDRIPADAIVLDGVNLLVDESTLTGESVPVRKINYSNEEPRGPGGEDLPFVYNGTLIVQGTGYAKVTHTAASTHFGKIGASLANVEETETRLQSEMKKLVFRLAMLGIIVSVLVVLAYYFTRGDWVQALLTGLSSAMAILPEEFPVVLTIFLALGAWRMSRRNVLTRKPSAIETLGSATVLCTDKTGTITQNKMEVVALYNSKEKIYRQEIDHAEDSFKQLIEASYLASQFEPTDPMEKAIRNLAQRSDGKVDNLWELLREYPLHKDLLAMTRIVKHKQHSKIVVSTKGAPEAIFQLCKLSDSEIEKHTEVINEFAGEGLRVIGVASAAFSGDEFPAKQTQFNFSFLGFLGLEDPVRDEVPQAIKECYTAGVKVIMITGDFPATATSIAHQIGLKSDGKIITGDALNNMSDETLHETIQDATVFARVIPEQKLRIVEALKSTGSIVAMTGDGVNDAPALKAAHIGVAMGKKGTDVAREASSLVLLDDNFASIVGAIRMGRRIFDNLQKAMGYILAIHVPIVGLALLPAFIPSLPILLLPLHIVFLELIIDPVCSIAFESEGEEHGIMLREPRKTTDKFFGQKRILYSVFQGLVTLGMVLLIYFSSLDEGHTDEEVRSITFSSLVIANIALILTDLSRTRNFIQVLMEPVLPTKLILGGAIAVLVIVLTIPAFQDIFSFGNIGFRHFIPPILSGVGVLLVFESIKYIRNKKNSL